MVFLIKDFFQEFSAIYFIENLWKAWAGQFFHPKFRNTILQPVAFSQLRSENKNTKSSNSI